jgi:spore maturation protein CgeB
LALQYYNSSFQRILAATRVVYTAKGGFGIPIRKYFEIPAAGALLVCSPCNGYDSLGFQAHVHYVPAEPEELPDVLKRLAADPDAQRIADAGRRLVADRHSLAGRGGQIARCLRAMVAGTYRSSRWEQGEFCVMEKI